MARLKKLAPGSNELDQVWGTRDEFYSVFLGDYHKSIERVDPVVIELCRLRVAQMVESAFDLGLRYSPARESGLSDRKIDALAEYPTSELFTSKERAALEFTEQWMLAFNTISDEDVARMQEFFSPEEFMYFCKALSVIDQFARANSAFRIQPALQTPSAMPKFIVRAAINA
jgi:alkylhydroperoxidase family enzyme